MTRKLSLDMVDIELDDNIDDCETNHYINIEIKNQDVLNRVNGKFYLNEEEECIEEISEFDKHLIGQTLKFRSPITCALSNGKICKTCYSDFMTNVNHDLHIGILAVLLLTNQLTQKLLSSKHLLQTVSTVIDWVDDFLKYFTIDKNQIISNVNKGFKLIINEDDLIEDEENSTLFINKFKVKAGRNEGNDINLDVNLEILPNLLAKFEMYKENGVISIPLDSVESDIPIFSFVIENNELSKSLQDILDLLDTNGHLELINIDDIVNKFLELLDEGGIHLQSTHAETILRSLLRDPEDETQFPDFSQEDFPEYTILPVTSSIIKGPALSNALVFERTKEQLENPTTYEKVGISNIDEFL